jgi:3-dehydroquinate dehydratase type I
MEEARSWFTARKEEGILASGLKRRSGRSEAPVKICVSVVETNHDKAARAIQEGSRVADLVELRVDYLKNPKLERLPIRQREGLILTCRSKAEGGRYPGSEKSRFEILKEAAEMGIGYLDVEWGSERPLLEDLTKNRKKTRMILSYHDFMKTPSRKELEKITDDVIQLGADVIKVVTFAVNWEDNLPVLSLIPYARERGQKIVAFCMGEKGKMSRIFAPWLGSAWTYAALNKAKTSAPGQLTVRGMKELWEMLA